MEVLLKSFPKNMNIFQLRYLMIFWLSNHKKVVQINLIHCISGQPIHRPATPEPPKANTRTINGDDVIVEVNTQYIHVHENRLVESIA